MKKDIETKTKDDVLLEILAPLGTEIPDPTGEYADLFAYLYDKIAPILNIVSKDKTYTAEETEAFAEFCDNYYCQGEAGKGTWRRYGGYEYGYTTTQLRKMWEQERRSK